MTGQAALRTKDGVGEGGLNVSLSNFRGSTVCSDKVQGVTGERVLE